MTQKQLDKKFKHAVDFGVITTKKNPETLRYDQKSYGGYYNSSARYLWVRKRLQSFL
ncbi:colicin D domain-containing protein [Photorhabdus laumondii]